MASFNLDDYVDVAERIKQFKAKHPEGSLQSFCQPYLTLAGEKAFMVYGAAAYRTPDDPRPGIGWAWEPVPGSTSFTRDSELQNAETAAWGRAIVALGFETKNIASRQEVRNRQPDRRPAATPGSRAASAPSAPSDAAGARPGGGEEARAISAFWAYVKGQGLKEKADVTALWGLAPDASLTEFVAERIKETGQTAAAIWSLMRQQARAKLEGQVGKQAGDEAPLNAGREV